MKTWRLLLLGNERGVALPLAMILLMVLTLLTITFMTLGAVEPQISRNLSDGARARQLAESGIEWGLSQLAGKAFDDSTLLGSSLTTGGVNCGTGITCKVLVTGQTLPGLTSSAGTFTVTLRNDLNSLTTDQALIGSGNPLDTSTSVDNNKIVILKSTGSFNGASKTITAVVQRGNLPINAAVSLPGVQGDTYTEEPPCSGCYSVDGRDWKDSDSGTSPTGTGSLKYAMTAATNAIETIAQNGFDNLNKRNYLHGKTDGDGYGSSTDGSNLTGATGNGRNTIANDSTLTPQLITKFMQNLASNPSTQILESTQACQYPASGGDHDKPEGIKMQSTGTPNVVTVTNNCGGAQQINQTVSLGSSTSPTMLYVRGQYDPDSLFRGLTVDGTNPITGYGILVVEDSDLAFFQTGNFRWNGIVLLTGRNNSSAFLGNSNTEIRGALIVNETNPGEVSGFSEFSVKTEGNMKIRSSKENIDRALMALYNMRVTAYREH
ncbi:MAG TPA: PilX N-terminal domain-containing pilus assembly protein [Methylomirabilota bacterium]|jgi:Tfp pilus assembly protein PilX|nr:PilX N-terminal domain-containing pilus assembly protein [Methylomirabilota bacterium]